MSVGILGYGLLGKALYEKTGWDVISRANGFNATDEHFYRHLLIDARIKNCLFPTIVNCIAVTNTYSENKQLIIDTNFKFVVKLVDFCNKTNTKLVHISTAYVYANSAHHPTSVEDVPVHAANWYSYSKLLADAHIESFSNDFLIVRALHKKFPEYKEAWIDQIGNYITPSELASKIKVLIDKDCKGIYNVGGEPKSIYDWSKQFSSVVPGNRPEFVPADVSMTLNKYEDDRGL